MGKQNTIDRSRLHKHVEVRDRHKIQLEFLGALRNGEDLANLVSRHYFPVRLSTHYHFLVVLDNLGFGQLVETAPFLERQRLLPTNALMEHRLVTAMVLKRSPATTDAIYSYLVSREDGVFNNCNF